MPTTEKVKTFEEEDETRHAMLAFVNKDPRNYRETMLSENRFD